MSWWCGELIVSYVHVVAIGPWVDVDGLSAVQKALVLAIRNYEYDRASQPSARLRMEQRNRYSWGGSQVGFAFVEISTKKKNRCVLFRLGVYMADGVEK